MGEPKKQEEKGKQKAVLIALITLTALFFLPTIKGAPVGPTLDYISQSESTIPSSTLENSANITGGVIAVVNMNVTQQDKHWKAYVGNVSGKLLLEDAQNYSIYEWTLTSVTGEVYATRAGSVNWSNVQCANKTHVNTEMTEMNHTSTYTPFDAINITFSDANNHPGFLAGASTITANSCNYTLNTFVNGSQQNSTSYFEEVLLYDGSSVIYATILEENSFGYKTGERYDYQMLVAEKGEPSFEGKATSYYFYVELQ